MKQMTDYELAVYRRHDTDCPYRDPWQCAGFTNALYWARWGSKYTINSIRKMVHEQ